MLAIIISQFHKFRTKKNGLYLDYLSLSKCLDYLYHSYMLQDPQVLGNDHNKPHSLMSDPISTMYFHNMFCDLLNKILFKPSMDIFSNERQIPPMLPKFNIDQ